MITSKLNEQTNNNLILLSDVPNLLKIADDYTQGEYGHVSLVISGATSLSVTGNSQYTLYFEGETISNVTEPENAINKNFYISRSNNGDKATAASIAMAFRNCSKIAANWNVTSSGNTVTLKTRKPMQTDTQSYSSDIISPSWNGKCYISVAHDGQDASMLTSANVFVDIFKGSNDEYVTTLEKKCNMTDVSFNLSPVLSTIAEYGEAIPFKYKVYFLTSYHAYYDVVEMSNVNYITPGYMCNQGEKYLVNSGITVAQNISRGTSWTTDYIDNRTLLYLYEPIIPVSFYKSEANDTTINVYYRDSAFTVLGSQTITVPASTKQLHEVNIHIGDGSPYNGYFNNSFYVDVEIDDEKTIRYNVIKPLKAAEYFQRIYFRNSYGGTSFFDFTGRKTETRSLSVKTYDKNVYGYYTADINEKEIIYDNEVNYTTTLKSHLFSTDGVYLFNDMLQSSKQWTVINGETYAIIIDSISVEEVDDNNNIWEATVSYHFSQKPSLY